MESIYRNGYLQSLTTAELEAKDVALTLEIRALCAWSNRALSKKHRLALVTGLRAQQAEVMDELVIRVLAEK